MSIETPDTEKAMLEILEPAKAQSPHYEGITEIDANRLPIYSEPFEDENWYAWGCDNMGAKWVSIDDWGEDYLSGHSAWSPIYPLVESLVETLSKKVGKEVVAKFTYEDEFRNFIGKATISSEEGIDSEELDGEEVNEWLTEEFGEDFFDEEVEWWDLYKDTGLCPQEFLDEKINEWFSEI